MCGKEHKNHNNILYEDIIPNIDKIKEYMKELRKSIDIFNKNIEEIINKFEKVKKNIEIYYIYLLFNFNLLSYHYFPYNMNTSITSENLEIYRVIKISITKCY